MNGTPGMRTAVWCDRDRACGRNAAADRIAKLRHEQFRQSSECGALLEQLELQLYDIRARVREVPLSSAPRPDGAATIFVDAVVHDDGEVRRPLLSERAHDAGVERNRSRFEC